jgi:hypothetical protein
MKFSNKTKNILKSVLCVVLVAATVLGAASLFSRKDDLKEIHPAFSIGGLSEQGKYVEQDDTIYTKEAFECEDLRIEVDFEKTITYKVFFYADNGEFISSTEEMTENFVNNVPDGAEFARVLITPDWEALEVEKDDRVISWFEIAKYSSQITIKVGKQSKKTDVDTDFPEENITDLAGTVWIINTVNVEPGKKIITNPDKSVMGEASSFTTSGTAFSTEFTDIGLGYNGDMDPAKNKVCLMGSDGNFSLPKKGYIIRFYDSTYSGDPDLIDFMRENGTLIYINGAQ